MANEVNLEGKQDEELKEVIKQHYSNMWTMQQEVFAWYKRARKAWLFDLIERMHFVDKKELLRMIQAR